VGIFFTCDKGQERKCINEFQDLLSQVRLRDLKSVFAANFLQYFEKDDPILVKEALGPEADDEVDIETEIKAELESLKPNTSDESKVRMITLDIPCVSFARLPNGVDPVALVHEICDDAFSHPEQKRSRYIKRMTPITLIKKTLAGGLEQLCNIVLKPHFHTGGPRKKFAIRPSIRNNNQIDRDTLIKTVADAVGKEHSVDLTNYDLLILVDVYRNVCGMSVVGNDYEKLKKYNLSEIYQPTLKPELKAATESKEQEPPTKEASDQGKAPEPSTS
jgi:tRNA acetyltransferase TAN1